MNIFAEIEGRDGENLVTSLFRVLFDQSYEVRKAFLELVARIDGQPALDANSYISCTEQETTRNESDTSVGYIDLLIRMKSAVIGIENKLQAGFTEGQPHKYLENVNKWADEQSRRSEGVTVDHFVLVVGPESRSEEIAAHIGNVPRLKFLSWQAVLEVMECQIEASDAGTRALVRAFKEFVDDRVSFMPKFDTLLTQLKGEFIATAADCQKKLVEQVSAMVLPRSPLRGNADWYGCYVGTDIPAVYAWIGFMKSSTLIQSKTENSSEFSVVTSVPINLPSEAFRPVKLNGNNFLYARKMNLSAWVVNYDSSWSTPDRWRKAFLPLRTMLMVQSMKMELSGSL